MTADVSEQHNVAADHPEVVKELTALLEKYIANGRSTTGEPQKNDVRIVVRKPPPRAGAEAAKGD